MERTKRRKLTPLFLFALATLLVCAGISYATTFWVMRDSEWRHDEPHGHQWLHEELGLTEEEAARIDAFEVSYREQRAALEAEFDQRMGDLAELIRSKETYSTEVTRAVHELHAVHGQLQQLAIEHYYEMYEVLPPEKQKRLREIAVEALSEPQ